VQNLGLRGPSPGKAPLSVVTTFDRPNLHYSAMKREPDAQEAVLSRLVQVMKLGEHRPAVIYANTKKETEELAARVTRMVRSARIPSPEHKVPRAPPSAPRQPTLWHMCNILLCAFSLICLQ
jgi:hypothetical protein